MLITVFKTNISEQYLPQLDLVLSQVDAVIEWNTDLDDCDKILRIVSHDNITSRISSLLDSINLECEELV